MADILFIVGTRPEIIKMSPIIRALNLNDFNLIHVGQHYDYNLSLQFIRELELPEPDQTFVLQNTTSVLQISEIIAKLHHVFSRFKPKMVVVQGDTNSVLAAGLAAIKNRIRLAHIEAGLRSYNWSMPEEHNRIIVDHISDLLFAPTESSRDNILRENVHGIIYKTGNTAIDAVIQNMPIASKRYVFNIPYDDFVLLTLHRTENVDDKRILTNLINTLIEASVQIVFPIHPHTVKMLKAFKLYDRVKNAVNIKLIDPVGYFDFLILMQKCRLIVTDSGGIQEEATCPIIRKHVILLRKSTERPEAVEAGFVKVVGDDQEHIINEIEHIMNRDYRLAKSSPFGDGKAGRRTAKLLLSEINQIKGK
jgi:UDP-N-acetylglucosamine 2-epimerase (non-hydrolysing)